MRKVSVDQLEDGMVTKKPVLGFLGQVMLNADIEIKPKHIYYLKRMGVNAVYVHDPRLEDVEVRDLATDELRSESRALIAQIMKDVDSASAEKKGLAFKEKEVQDVISKVVNQVLNVKDAPVQISDIRTQDGYVFAHSVNCCLLATLIGARMNYEARFLHVLATGALIHDIGLVAIPRAILKKPGALTDEEYSSVKKHPAIGYELFRRSKMFSERVGEVILSHHERYLGQGYPGGLREKEIPSLARIVMVADVFDALTSDKVYRLAYPVHKAMEMLNDWSGELFDPEVVDCFLESLAAYPIGTHVMLSNGESGLVVANIPGYTHRPVVRLLYKKDFSPHPSPYDLDLSRVKDMAITGLVGEDKAALH